MMRNIGGIMMVRFAGVVVVVVKPQVLFDFYSCIVLDAQKIL